MKKELLFTDEDKVEFCAKLKSTETLNKVKGNYNFLKMIPISGLMASFLCGGLLLISGNPIWLSFLAPLFVTTVICPVIALLPLSYLIPSLKEFKNLSNGKIPYRQYKKLVKSGEIAKWQEQLKPQIEQRINQIRGIEVEEYKKDAEEQIIRNVYNNLPNKDSVALDADKIAKEVKKIVNENNERNR